MLHFGEKANNLLLLTLALNAAANVKSRYNIVLHGIPYKESAHHHTPSRGQAFIIVELLRHNPPLNP